MYRVFGLVSILCLTCCTKPSKSTGKFISKTAKETGIDFENKIENSKALNIFNYRNFYNGGGVAIGDLNNDGLADVFFTANMGSNKLYLNQGDFKFEDVTEQAGLSDSDYWSTGVSLVDINNDGFLDIYVSNAGYFKDVLPENKLYINNQDLTFTERSEEYNLHDSGYTTHAAFFDYDLDGDLDVYILNNSFIPVNTLNYSNNRSLRAEDWPEIKDFLKGGGDKLMRNDGGRFTDVSEEAGIFGSLIGFGLGVTVGDVDRDGLLDIYVSNDFYERDYLYMNQGDGTFSEELESRIEHLSLSSMGADMADLNNDGADEIFVTDMLPKEEYRLKTTTNFEGINTYNLKVDRGFYHQYTQNTLQLNSGDGRYAEVSNFSGVSASDWSWGALIFDVDNDSFQDIFVSNGIYHDVIDQDFIDFFANDVIQQMTLTGKKEELESVINRMPSVPIPNSLFVNDGALSFNDRAGELGLDAKTFSNGSAYGDLDNDGDLDLVVSNVNQPALVYENALTDANHYIGFNLQGASDNIYAIGAEIQVFHGKAFQSRKILPNKGFQSSVDYKALFGLGATDKVDSVRVIWPDLSTSAYQDLVVDSVYKLTYESTERAPKTFGFGKSQATTLLSNLEFPSSPSPHQEDEHVDFYFERNIPVMLSQEGPALAVADLNGDGNDDLFVGGAKGTAGAIYFGGSTGFVKQNQPIFQQHQAYEDTAAAFFDADGDGDQDLIVGSGGNFVDGVKPQFKDRLYVNNNGRFTYQESELPATSANTSVILPLDFDQDGDLDVFVGSRSIPQAYGVPPKSYLLRNNGKGNFQEVPGNYAEPINRLGMITDAIFQDIDGDNANELVIVGEWMAPQIVSFHADEIRIEPTNLKDELGWWRSIAYHDVDGDGDQDLVLGNRGNNAYFKASKTAPLKIWINDFDNNGSIEKIITRTIEGKDYPLATKKDMLEQVVALRKENLKHSQYAKKTIQELFDTDMLQSAIVRSVTNFNSVIAYNQGDLQFTIENLPQAVQYSCVNTMLFSDVDCDGDTDLILGGNDYNYMPQFSRLDASFGHVLVNDGQGELELLPNQESGFTVRGEMRNIQPMKLNDLSVYAVGVNDEPVMFFKKKKNGNGNCDE